MRQQFEREPCNDTVLPRSPAQPPAPTPLHVVPIAPLAADLPHPRRSMIGETLPAPARRAPVADRWLWALVAASALAVMAMMVANRLPVMVASPAFAVLVLAVGALLETWRRCARAATPLQARMRDLCEYGLVLIAIGVLGGVASYQVAALSRGFCDDMLQRWDTALHFDWLSLYRLVVSHPVLQYTGSAAYDAVFLYPWAILIWHAWNGERAQAREFLLTFWLAAVITLALFPLFPARGALAHLWHGAVPYAPSNGLDQGTVIATLRAHALGGIDLGTVTGVVSAPSFHTVCGVLFIAFSWRIVPLRLLIVPLNLMLLAATPIEGSHYLIDMVIGALVASTALVLVRKRATLLTLAQGLAARRLRPAAVSR